MAQPQEAQKDRSERFITGGTEAPFQRGYRRTVLVDAHVYKNMIQKGRPPGPLLGRLQTNSNGAKSAKTTQPITKFEEQKHTTTTTKTTTATTTTTTTTTTATTTTPM